VILEGTLEGSQCDIRESRNVIVECRSYKHLYLHPQLHVNIYGHTEGHVHVAMGH